MKMRWVWLATLVVALVGCQAQESSSKQILKLSISDDPVSLDPREVRSLKDLTLVKQLYEGLMRMGADGKPELALAERVKISDDLTTYTFFLREATWADGSQVTAQDFVNAWQELLYNDFACDYAYMLYPIRGARGDVPFGAVALDQSTLEVRLNAPLPYFLELVAFPTYFPVRKGMSNGPFMLKSWKQGTSVSLKKNPHYWDADAVYLDGIDVSILADNNTETLLFDKGEIDWLGQPMSNNLPTALVGKLKTQGALQSYPIAGTFWFKFNTQKQPFNNAKVRRAFSYSIDRQQIIDHVLQGNQRVATSPIPPSMALSDKPYFKNADVERAKQLVDEALGQMKLDKLPKITLSYSPTERNKKIVQLVQQQWKDALGVTVELEAVERALYRRNVKEGKYQVGTGDWIADFNDPIAFLELFAYLNDSESGSGMNGTRWNDKEFVSLLALSALENNPQKRRDLLLRAEEIFVKAMPVAPVYHYCFDYRKKTNVESVVLSPLGLADFKTAKLR